MAASRELPWQAVGKLRLCTIHRWVLTKWADDRIAAGCSKRPSSSRRPLFGFWVVSFVWLNKTNKMNKTNQIDQMNKTGWQTFSASC